MKYSRSQVTRHKTQVTSEYYYHYDGIGSVTAITNSSGSIVESYSYDAYGNITIKNAIGTNISQSAVGNRYMFTGREYDQETGLYYYRNRYYDPSLGRFISQDPSGISNDINLYAYCSNNPVNFTDPFGLCKEKIKKTGWWPKELDLLVPGYRNYGGPSRNGPGEPEDLMDVAFQRHDIGYGKGELGRADYQLIYDLDRLPANPRKLGEEVNPVYAITYRAGARTIFSARISLMRISREVIKAVAGR